MTDSKDFETVIEIRNDRDLQLLRNIYAYGWSEMSLAQQTMLPKLMNKDTYNDVSFQYPSGMGKSGVYILTMLYNLSRNPCVSGLIILPTRELANQVYTVSCALAKKLQINICRCIGKEALSDVNPEWPTIVIGTCGKVIDILCKKGGRPLKQECALEYFVVDEVDNFICDNHNKNLHDLESIVKTLCSVDTHVFTVSATFSKYVRDFIRSKMMNKDGKNIEMYLDDCEVTLNGITQYYVDLTEIVLRQNVFNSKIETLLDIIPIIGIARGIIFVNHAGHAKQVYDVLIDNNYTCEVIYGKMNQEERNAIMKKFANSGTNFLIATDLIARGIDFKDVAYVVQLELPVNMEDYIHRIGRSGRYGKVGKAISIICGEDEQHNLNILKEKYDITLRPFEFGE